MAQQILINMTRAAISHKSVFLNYQSFLYKKIEIGWNIWQYQRTTAAIDYCHVDLN
jgi:type II restriction/modification system DNA methylase subunit YeeA